MSGHGDGEHKQVRAAANPRVMAPLLDEVFERGHGSAVCRVLNVKYEPGSYCTILYSLDDLLVMGVLRWDGAGPGELPDTARLIEPLGMQVYRFEHDPALPGLEQVLNPQAIAAALSDALPELRDDSVRIAHCRVTPLRYRPGRRCTLRLDLALRDSRRGGFSSRTLFGKVYHDLGKASSVYNEMRMLSSCPAAREGALMLAAPAAFLPDLGLVLQEPVAGVPLDMMLEGMALTPSVDEERCRHGMLQSAVALATLHTSGLATDRQRPIEDELVRFKKRAAAAGRVDLSIGAQLAELAEALPAWLPMLEQWGAEITLVHGDCKPSQFLVGPAGVAILDFDHCGMADPATDVGTYLATLRQLGIWQSLVRRRANGADRRMLRLLELEDHFLETYCTAGKLRPAFRLRATWYEAVALLRKALRAFARSPRSAMPVRMVQEAWRCLAELPGADQPADRQLLRSNQLGA